MQSAPANFCAKMAVLIACHNRRQKTLSCLEKLYASERPEGLEFDVFLLDDGSTDGTSRKVSAMFPMVRIIQGTGDLYWARGMRAAWQEAAKGNYDYYLWLNDDTFLFPDALHILFTSAHRTKSKAIICSALVSRVTKEVTYGGKMRNDLNFHIPDGKLAACEIMAGNCVLVPKAVFEKIGMIDHRFHHAIGDFDYGLRAVSAGIECYVAPAATGYCEINPLPPKWCQREVSFVDRLRSLYSPLGYAQPAPYFIYVARHFGLLQAIRQLILMHVRVAFPHLWKAR